MRWLERLPPIVKVLFVLGGALLTAFASRLPEGLQTIGAYTGIVLVVAGLIGAGLHWSKESRGADSMEPVDLIRIGIAGVALFALILGGGFAWKMQAGRAQSVTKAKPNPLDQTIQLECEWVQIPDLIPPDGWREIQIYDQRMSGGVMTSSLPPGAKNNTKGPNHPDQIYRCEFTNFGTSPVVNVEATLTVILDEVSWSPDGMSARSGPVAQTFGINTPRGNIGTGDQNHFGFFVSNLGQFFANVVIPATARVQKVGTSEWQVASLIPPRMGSFGLNPFFPTASTDQLSLFMADTRRDEPSAAVRKIRIGEDEIPAAIPPAGQSKNGFAYFYLREGLRRNDFDDLISSWEKIIVRNGGDSKEIKHLIFVYDGEWRDNVKEHVKELASRDSVVIEFRGSEYVTNSISGLKSGSRKIPPQYGWKDGLPVPTP